MSYPQNPGSRPTNASTSRASGRTTQDKPAWAEGIRALYDAVTQEPLPSDFQNLLDQLGKIRKK
ncbi:MAG: hypothetical protein M3N34_10270 [Pseudomonadota bacterium]|nr:hypothetical protein [Pseudomonadota bacterium]